MQDHSRVYRCDKSHGLAKTVKPLVSIILPVYNGESYLTEAIQSALAQTYEPIELIVINDGSTDRTEEIALSYGDKIRYYSKENGGVSTALNLGIAKMRGEYFSWLSHDDLYKPEKVQIQIKALVNDPTQIVYSDYTIIDKYGASITTMNIAEKYPDADFTVGLFPILHQVLNGCSLLIHKSHFARVGTFKEHLRVTQDYELWYRMFRGEKLVYVNQSLVMLREHGEQVTHNYERNRMESDELWLNMLTDMTPLECIGLYGSELEFWNRQTEFLWCTPFKNARRYANSKLNALGGRKPSFKIFYKRGAYKILTAVSWVIRQLRIQKHIKKSKLFHWGYKMWLGVRYK